MYFNDDPKLKNKAALIDDQGYSMTYGELGQTVAEIQGRISKRTLVFMLCTNSVASVAGYIGFIANGIVPLLLSANVQKSVCGALIEIYQPGYLYLPIQQKEEYGEYLCLWEFQGYCLLKTKCRFTYDIHPEVEVLLPTSGSTGSPKFVRIPRCGFQTSVKAVIECCGYNGGERYITMLPMSHVYGLNEIRCRLFVGATILLTDKQVIDKGFWEFFGAHNVTSFTAIPYVYEMLEKVGFYSLEMPELQIMSVGGGKVSKKLIEKIWHYANRRNIKLIMVYGSTEVCSHSGVLILHKDEKSIEDNCIASPIPTMAWQIYSKDGEVITGKNLVGELRIVSDCCAMGYAEKSRDLNKDDEWKGVYDTGDLVYLGEDGYYYLAGRKQRFEKVFGNRISLDDIEKFIRDFLCIVDCACVGKENHIYICVTSENADRDKEIRKLLVSRTGMPGNVFEVKVLKVIPRSAAGKILYREIGQVI